MWISTSNGLNRYDGINFKVYKHDPRNDESLSDNAPGCIFQDSKNRLWVSTIGKGLNRYNRDRDTWVRYNSNPDDPNTLTSNDIGWIIEDFVPGNLWIATYNGLNYFDDKSQTFHRFLKDDSSNEFQGSKVKGSIYRNDITYILRSRNENCIWIGYGNKIGRFLIKENRFEVFDLYFQEKKLDNTTAIYSIFEDSSNKLWVGTEGYGLFQFSKIDKKFNNIKYPDNNTHAYAVRTIFEDTRKQLWIGYNGDGLGCFDLNSGTYSHYVENNSQPNGLNNNTIYCITQSNDGILWFGSFGDGINIIDQKKSKFELYRNIPNETNTLSNSHVREIYEDDNGILWLGTSVMSIYNCRI
jgi:ligand-binding sensor domain-containing protein